MAIDRELLFARLYRGDNAGVLAATVEAGVPVGPAEAAAVIGALTFMGRIEEAQYLFRAVASSMDVSGRVIARSFLTIELARTLRFGDAARLIVDSARERHNQLGPEARALFYQGIAIHHYFAGRLHRARVFAERARGEALLGGFVYGRVCSMDLLGHVEVALGEVHRGLELLDRTRTLAATLGHGWLVNALRVNVTCYQVRHGMAGERTISLLRELLEADMDPDSFNRPVILLELSRQLILQGKCSEAADILQASVGQIYTKQNERFDCEVALVLAHAHTIQGDLPRAQALLSATLQRISGKGRVQLELSLCGLLDRVERSLGVSSGGRDIYSLSRASRALLSLRMENRERGIFDIDQTPGRDPLGDLIDRAHLQREQAFQAILDSGYHGLLFTAFRLPPGGRVIAIDVDGGRVVLLDRGDVFVLQQVPEMSRRLLCQFAAAGVQSKEALCERVWGYRYHPERHDGSIYTAISKLRRLHPVLDAWIRVSHDGYDLESGVEVRVLREFRARAEVRPEEDGQPAALAKIAGSFDLNLRQTEILTLVRELGSIDVKKVREVFQVSEITASRDLRVLSERELLRRVGRGRATRYSEGPRFAEVFTPKPRSDDDVSVQ